MPRQGGIAMNRIKVICILALFMLSAVAIYAQDATVKEGNSKDIAQLIIGKWEIAPNKRAASGDITFDDKGNYEMNEIFHDGTGVGKKGEYKLNSDVSPVTIDICLGKCGQPGSEWTTYFGILRVLSNDKIEIYTSPTSKYPSDFPDDTKGEYTMILTRTE